MSRQQNIAWEEVLELRVVQALVRHIEGRWGLGIGFYGASGEPVESHHQGVGDGPCGLLWDQTRSSCHQLGPVRQLAQEGKTGGTIQTCHAGLREVACPIVIEGQTKGVVLAGGFRAPGDGDLQDLQRALEQAGLRGTRVQQALAQITRLDRQQQQHLCELVELVAQEVARFQSQNMAAERRNQFQDEQWTTKYSYDDIIGKSRPMKDLYHLLDKVIGSESTVLIQGDNGTGKELIAKAIHYNSHRKDRRFVVQNCSAFNDNLLDSELFGHKKGAFTGAISDKQGLFEVADGSTFFLDEIGDMSAALQVKLLRVLQEGTFIPVGDTQPKKVDVRIIAATNRDLKQMVEDEQFREDLYYRINVINIHIPPLRDRREDIPMLVEHFLTKHALGQRRQKKLSKGCLSRLMEYAWPGNIRELENEIERLVVLAGDEKLVGDDLLSSRISQSFSQEDMHAEHNPNCLPDAIKNLERTMIYEVLKRNHWNKTRAAAELGISRRNLIRKVHKYKLEQRRTA